MIPHINAQLIILLTGSILFGISAGITTYLSMKKMGEKSPASKYNPVIWSLTGFFFGIILTGKVLPAFLPAAMFCFLPALIEKRKKAVFIEKFNKQLLNAIAMISSSLKAGQSMVQAICMSAGRLPNPVGKEFEKIANENRMGVAISESLRSMSSRIQSNDLKLMVNATIVCMETGGNVTEMYDKIAATIRTRNRMNEKLSALTSQGKLQGLIVGLLPVIMLAVLGWLAPEMISPLFCTIKGIIMLIVALVMELTGAYFIIRLTSLNA